MSEQVDIEKVIAELEELEAKSCVGDINSAACGHARQEFRAALMEAWPALLAAAKRVAALERVVESLAPSEAYEEALREREQYRSAYADVRRQLDATRMCVAELTEALRPFASIQIHSSVPDSWSARNVLNEITVAQLRAAGAAVAKGGAA